MENHISLLFHLLLNKVDLCQLGSVKIHYNIYKAGAISSGQRLSSWRDFWGGITVGEKMSPSLPSPAASTAPLIWARFLGRNHCGRENVGEIAVDKIAVGGLNLATRPSLILL